MHRAERQSHFKPKVGKNGPNIIHHINGIKGKKSYMIMFSVKYTL